VLKPSTIRALRVPDSEIEYLLDVGFGLPPGITETAFQALDQEAKDQAEGGPANVEAVCYDAMHAGYTVGRLMLADQYEAQPSQTLRTRAQSMMLDDLIPLLCGCAAHVAVRVVERGNQTLCPRHGAPTNGEFDEVVVCGWAFGLGVACVQHDGQASPT
jgi:hypothetical protein